MRWFVVTCIGLTLGLVGFVIAAIDVGFIEVPETPRQTVSQKPKVPSLGRCADDRAGAWTYMKEFVKKRLRAPATADFPFIQSRFITNLGGGRYRVAAYVDAQNAFGATLRTHFNGVIVCKSDSWRLEHLNIDG